VRRAYWDLERRVLRRASGVTVTAEGTAALYRDRYPDFPADRIRVIPNGFDEQAFEQLPLATPRSPRRAGPVRFLHSGTLYPYERNPDWFFRALAELRAEGRLSPDKTLFELRGTAHDDCYAPKLAELGLTDMVRLLPGVPYRDALQDMTDADVLMLFQADNCNLQIPAKLYEYLYVGRPVMGLTDPAGDTGRLLAELGIDAVARLDDVAAIKTLVLRCVQQATAGTAYAPTRESIMRFSRAGTTGLLARFLDELVVGANCADGFSSGR
jgi:glycosyltransferase involved in cell wall biosynthesis